MHTITLVLSALATSFAWATPIIDLQKFGDSLGGWSEKQGRAAQYQRSDCHYRTWKPEITPMLDGGIFISLRIDHLRGVFASDDHASLLITINKDGDIIDANSSIGFQGRKITSDAIRLSSETGSTLIPSRTAAAIGTTLLADLSSKLLRENVIEPGRISFPAILHHNYHLLCLATGLVEEPEQQATKEPESPNEPPEPTPLKIPVEKSQKQHLGKSTQLPPLQVSN